MNVSGLYLFSDMGVLEIPIVSRLSEICDAVSEGLKREVETLRMEDSCTDCLASELFVKLWFCPAYLDIIERGKLARPDFLAILWLVSSTQAS